MIKKTLLFAVLLSFMGICSAQNFSAVSPSGHTLYYNIVNGEAQVTSEEPSPSMGFRPAYANLQGHVIIPDSVSYNGVTYPVTSLGYMAFLYCPQLNQLTLPTTMRVIGAYSISVCQALDSVSIPNSVQVIDTGAFSASFIRSIRIPDSVTVIRYRAFRNCSRLKSVTLHSGITSIEAGAFSWCSSLPDLLVPSTTTIETATAEDNAAFYEVQHVEYHGSSTGAPWGARWLNGLRDGEFVFNGAARDTLVSWIGTGSTVTIPATVKAVNPFVFYQTGLTSVTMPSTMTSIGESAFQGCNLTEITLPDSLTTIGDNAFYESNGLTSLTIPDAVTSIGNYAFYNCTGLTAITLGTGLRSIEQRAFMGCTGVESITIPDSVASIGSQAFFNVPHIEYHGNATGAPWGANTMNGVREGDYLFNDTTHTTILAYLGNAGRVTVPDGVTTIGASAFKNNTDLFVVELPNTVTTIEDEAFRDCPNLLRLTLPDTMGSIGGYAFTDCESLTSIVWPHGVLQIPTAALSGCVSLTSMRIPNTVTNIGSNAFYGCESLTSVTLPDSLRIIGPYAFSRCTGLTSVTLPDSLQIIGNYAFSRCTGLTSVTIPEGVVGVYNGAFRYCDNLTSVSLPSSLASIINYVFAACPALEEITCHALTAPSTAANTFANVDSAAVVNIPCGSLASYQAAWLRFHNYSESFPYVFSATSADPTMGSVTVLTAPSCQDTAAVVEATPAAGNLFVRWNDGNTDNPRTLVVTADTHLVANFAIAIHDTTYVDVHDTTFVDVHDTTFIDVHDTTFITQIDTLYLTDTLWMNDTLVFYDTVYIHDTIYVGVDEVETTSAKVYVQSGQIVVDGAEGDWVALYDATGRLLATRRDTFQPLYFPVTTTGAYLVKIGNHPARKVVVKN